MSAYWDPHLILTSSESRYSKLYVEIDAVEGSGPNATEISALRSFLEAYCRKPAGIQVEMDDLIPRAEAEGHHSRTLSLKHLDGVPDEDSAFIYFLFFDSDLSPEKKSRPVCMLTPYPGAIFFDQQFAETRVGRKSEFRQRAILHEAAHALGLARAPSHSVNLHCTNKDCLMNSELTVRISKILLGGDPMRQVDFCNDCKMDLESMGTGQPAKNLSYLGRYFVRSEELYHVITQPGLLYVHVGPLKELDEEKLEGLRRETMMMMDQGKNKPYATSSIVRSEAAGIAAAMLEDPVNWVRDLGADLQKQIKATEAP